MNRTLGSVANLVLGPTAAVPPQGAGSTVSLGAGTLTVTDSTTSQITIDTGGVTITFAAPAGQTLPVIATGTFVEARGVTINGVLTLTRLRTEDCDGGGSDGNSGPDDGGGCGD